ncbi:hypothetical protein AB0J28_09920, partial [Streptosporangium canum]|uniref:hypothetical protein n=1 Tax=Streptosporangium canum TaxID=324952 RepID=UPI0034205B41
MQREARGHGIAQWLAVIQRGLAMLPDGKARRRRAAAADRPGQLWREAKWAIVTALSALLPAFRARGRCVPGPAEEPQPGTQT